MTAVLSDAALRSDVDQMLCPLVGPALADLTVALRSVPGLTGPEQQALHAGVTAGVTQAVWRRVSRVVLLELNAARVTGGLAAQDSAGRWREWVDRLAGPGGWEAVAAPYPPLLPRLRTIVANRCAAGFRLAHRFAADRPALGQLLRAAPGELAEVEGGAGDSHHGGQSVTILRCAAGQVVYKPRSVQVDAVLARFLDRLLASEPAEGRLRVPQVLTRQDSRGPYGWAVHVPHRYCTTEAQFRAFYRGLGQWLAVMRLLRGSDLHHENVVACGPVPVVVDCETLFTPLGSPRPSGYGAAVDLAIQRIEQSLLRTGLLPGRGAALGWRGVDVSGAGFLPGQQPQLQVPTIADAGSDRARLALTAVAVEPSRNLPSTEPDLGRFWECVVDGFTELTGRLHNLDRAGKLAPMLADFRQCQVRVVVRDTASYAELGRMLWHPSSLHRPGQARQRAAELLALHARRKPGAPGEPAVIDAEITELLDGDVPVFVTTAGSGVLAGPRGTRYGPASDLVADALAWWRDSDPAIEQRVLRAALVGAYLNDGWRWQQRKLANARPRTGGLERRRRGHAAALLQQVASHAIWGDDGSVTWVAPVLAPAGWAVQPLPADLYGGTAGVAVLLAGYRHELAKGRADPVPELERLLAAAIGTLRLADDQHAADRREADRAQIEVRPQPPGGYLGIGSRIWAWLLLHRLGVVTAAEATRRGEALAAQLPDAVASDPEHDLVTGSAGALVPLLALAARVDTGSRSQPDRWRELACQIGHRLGSVARFTDAGAGWPTESFPAGIGGLSHGVTGIGWALARLAEATGSDEFRQLADAAFAREESHFIAERGAWRDVREPADRPVFGASWCHGSVGIGIAAADLLAREGGERWRHVLRRAAAATTADGFGWNHTLCHGDFGAWELLERAWAAGLGPAGAHREALAAQILTNLEEHGPVSGMARDAFSPGLLAGVGGVVYQLLRMHPECDLPSVLLPDPAVRDS